jgi:hypothetical protein
LSDGSSSPERTLIDRKRRCGANTLHSQDPGRPEAGGDRRKGRADVANAERQC